VLRTTGTDTVVICDTDNPSFYGEENPFTNPITVPFQNIYWFILDK
jgi:hypothetical protein